MVWVSIVKTEVVNELEAENFGSMFVPVAGHPFTGKIQSEILVGRPGVFALLEFTQFLW